MPVKFYAHEVILAAHSPMFTKMLKHNMKEGVSNEVTIPDVELDVLNDIYIHQQSPKHQGNDTHPPLCCRQLPA